MGDMPNSVAPGMFIPGIMFIPAKFGNPPSGPPKPAMLGIIPGMPIGLGCASCGSELNQPR
jgi:hypothetical protein